MEDNFQIKENVQKRKLYQEKQSAKLKNESLKMPNVNGNNDSINEQENNGKGDLDFSSQTTETSKSFRAIINRLERERQKEREQNQLSKIQSKQDREEISESSLKNQSLKRLQTIYRIINGASATTLVGLIFSFLIMNAQFLMGNLLKTGLMPSLEKKDIGILLFIDFLFFILFLIGMVFIYILTTVITDPFETIKQLSGIAWDTFKSLFK